MFQALSSGLELIIFLSDSHQNLSTKSFTANGSPMHYIDETLTVDIAKRLNWVPIVGTFEMKYEIMEQFIISIHFHSYTRKIMLSN